MAVLTVDELYKELADARKRGLGKKKVMLSNDDEGNGYHLLFYGLTEDVKPFFEGRGCCYLPCSVKRAELSDYVIVG